MNESTNTPFQASKRGDRHKTPEQRFYRFLTLDECKTLHGRVAVLDRMGDIAEVTITSVKTWKRRPDVKIGWKFGLYEYGSILIMDDSGNDFFVIEVKEPEQNKPEESPVDTESN